MSHPYSNLPDSRLWRRSVKPEDIGALDLIVDTGGLHIDASDQVMTAGSCFAQHIARHLRNAGFGYMVTEKPHPLVADVTDDCSYATYTARYGNVYTPRQLLQLLRRSLGQFHGSESVWSREDGTFVDPYRPQIESEGFSSAYEVEQARDQHLAATLKGFTECDVFVFTLGLTEAWVDKTCGSVYPVCPGVAGGTWDENKYDFVNFSVDECEADLRQFITELRKVNPDVWIFLTVSPVPLIATAREEHVAVATSYSKSVLRVCTENLRDMDKVVYFPSYEVITSPATAGRYFTGDLREVAEIGVNHVMGLFFKHFTDGRTETASPAPVDGGSQLDVVEVECDEEAYA